VKSRFPLLHEQPTLIFLDSASTTQRLDTVLKSMDYYYRLMNANVHRALYLLSEQATVAYEGVRDKAKDFLNARFREEIIFTHGATESLNMVAHCWGGQNLKEGDEVVLTVMEHHSNLVPWQMVAQRAGAVLKFCPLTSKGDLDYESLENLIGSRTKMVALTGLSNTLGTVVDVKRVADLAHHNGALISVDAAQLVAHFPIDVQELDLDFLSFSAHKMYGPTGVGILYGKRAHLENMEPWMGGGGMIREVHQDRSVWNDLPFKFEAGTPPIAEVIGFGAAFDFFKEVGFDFIQEHDVQLQNYFIHALQKLSYIQLLGPLDSTRQRGVFSFLFDQVHPHDVSALLGQGGVCVRAGHHCTMPLMKILNVPSTTRVSFGIYNTFEDVNRLVEGLEKVACTFKV